MATRYFGEFDSSKEDWQSYTERLAQHFKANDITDADKKRAILLSNCGPATYRQIKSVLTPKTPDTVDYMDILASMSHHLQPVPSEIVQRYLFHSRIQKSHESISVFVAELKKLSEHCNSGDNLDQMLRDRLVCGVADERWQKRLLAEEKLTFDSALKIVLAHSSGKAPGSATSCYRCGGCHLSNTCRFKDTECHHCKKKGHIARVCRSRHRQSQRQNMQTRRSKHQLQGSEVKKAGDIQESHTDTEYSLHSCRTGSSKPIMVKALMNNVELMMEVDTGATLSIMSEKTYRESWPTQSSPTLQPSEAKLKTYTGEDIPIKGKIQVDVTLQHQRATLPLLVVQGNGPTLLGRDWLQVIQLDWSKLHSVHSVSKNDLQEALDRHPAVFKNELGHIKNMEAKIYVDADAKPRFFRARPVPYALRQGIEKELECLLKDGVIEQVQFSEWAAPVVPDLKKDNSVRLCGD